MIALVRRWLQRRRTSRVAREIADSPEASALARAWANATLAAIAEGRSICGVCLNPCDPRPRDWAEWFRYRSVLMIPDAAPNPVVCDGCFETATAAFNPQATNVGTSNSGPPNFALRHLN